jgi:hypothetical protein
MRGAVVALVLPVVGVLASGEQVAGAPVSNSADRMMVWTSCSGVSALTDAQLDMWKSRGVDGFVCMGRHLYGMGGAENFTGDPNADLS